MLAMSHCKQQEGAYLRFCDTPVATKSWGMGRGLGVDVLSRAEDAVSRGVTNLQGEVQLKIRGDS